VKKFSSAIRTVCVAACALAMAAGSVFAQAAPRSQVLDLIAQAKAQIQGQAKPGAASQQGGALAPTGKATDMTMDEAVAKALQLNIDLSVERLNPQLQDWSLKGAFAAYVPTVNGTFGQTDQVTMPANIYQGGDKVTSKSTQYDFGATMGVRKTGGTATASWTNSRQDSDSNAVTINPQYNSRLRLSFSQPLLRNRTIDANRQGILQAEINRRIADISLRAATVNTVANTKNAYWDYVYSVQAVDAAKTSLALAQKLVEDNKVKVEIGTLAPLDIVTAQAEAATREQNLVTADANRRTAELVLKRLIVGGTSDPIWGTSINPIDRPATDVAEKIDLEAALKTALENRTDLVTARRNLEVSDVTLKYQHVQTLPQADLSAYYLVAGTGGTILERRNAVTGAITTPLTPGGYTDALSQLFNVKQPTWNVAVTVSYPIGTSAQEATLARTKVQYQQSLAQLKALELTVATDLTNQAMTVQSSFQQVQTARASRELSQKRLEAEQSKFEVGMSTNYNVVLAQRDFTDAQNSELRATLNYRKALVDFQRKQETAAR
jgi:outer membrane protein